ncbi:MAG TPA: glycoside hydrolase family 2 protein [Clostridiales bacterium]|nr:glycoside hydrolase family 2 protein [Clostridiales bacterium]
MISKKWNSDWTVSKPGDNPMMAAMMGMQTDVEMLTLPHDAMIHETRTESTKNKHQTGFYPGGCYTYTKVFEAPQAWSKKSIHIEFEGVYENARVYINGDYAGGCPNGYRGFLICADDFLNYGASNTITVIANNSAEENSRWYTGSGIYRDVYLLEANPVHIKSGSLRIGTKEIDDDLATVEVYMKLANQERSKKKTRVHIMLQNSREEEVANVTLPVTVFGEGEEHIRTRIQVENPELWSCEAPSLYTCIVRVMTDEECLDETIEQFGIRQIALSAKKGFRLNGKEVKLRGACIHHDNGVIGAVTLERAEERRVQQLKAAGFNCLRSSHHPMSEAMLRACDREGMLVLDELADFWTRSKNNNDYANKFPDYWEEDVEAMVAKDYNHPSVIMYVSGNEIQEAASAKGAQLNRLITEKFHSLDDSRYVTVAINGLLSCIEHMGEIMSDITGMTMEQMMQMQAQAPQSDAGVDAANGSTDLMKGPMADAFAANHIVTGLLDEFASVTDLVGYNYLTARHEMEHELFPHRVILGTETLPSDLVRLWRIVKNNSHVIGDMTWTGYDYLGEAGSSCFYYDGRQGFMTNWPISLSGMGDIDIIGNRRPISYYREIVYGLRKEPYIGVERVNHFGEKPNQSAWPWKDELESWTWDGYEGKGAVVNVYSDAEEVELYKNGVSLGRKGAGEEHDFYASFETTYEPGILEAVNYRNGVEAEKTVLKSARGATELCVEVDRNVLKADGADLSYLMISMKDEAGTPNLQEAREVSVTVEGAGTLQGMGNADPGTENSYDNHTWKLYDGYVLAVVRSGFEAGEIRVTISAEGCAKKEVVLGIE